MITLFDKIRTYLKPTSRKSYVPTSEMSKPFEAVWSFGTTFTAFICLVLIFVLSAPSSQQIISPFVASIQSASMSIFGNPSHEQLQTFTFVPGDSPRKFSRIDFTGLNILSYYDVPINADGTLSRDTDAYATFRTSDADGLFQTAHQNGTKVLLTLTMTYNPDIANLLNNSNAQQELFNQAAQEIRETGLDGVTLAIEYKGTPDATYKTKYSAFIKKFTEHMHANVPNAIVSVAIPDTTDTNSLYDLKELSDSADKVMIVAYTFAVPESDNNKLMAPVFGFNNEDYLSNLNDKENTFLASVPSEKLLMERAWYGNGNKYPLYAMDKLNEHKNDLSQNTLTTPLSDAAIERLISDVPDNAKAAARKNLPYIATALEQEGILNANVLAYALATIQHETANTFEPIEEFKGRKSARRLGYEGGTNYFGRGFIQLTHLRNYQKIGQRIGLGEDLAKHPELASQPEVAAKVLAAYFKDFGIAKQASEGNFVQARALINPDYNGESIAAIALGFLYALS